MKFLLLLTCCLMFMSMLSTCDRRIDVKTPSTQMILPEAIGEPFLGEASFFLAQGTLAEVDLENEKTNNALVLGETNDLIGNFGLNLEVGTVPNVDIMFRTTGKDAPSMLGLKYQFLGDPRKSARKGNSSMAIFGFIGATKSSEENDDAVEINAKDEEVQSDLDILATDVGLVYGYRLEDEVLVYIGSTYSKMSFKGDLESDVNTTLDGDSIDYSGNTWGANLGFLIDLNSTLSLKLEASHQKINWEKTTSQSFNYLAFGFGLNWF